MLGVPIVDTSETFLTLWASFPSSLLPQVDAMKALAPQHIMKVTPERAWIPLWKDKADAVSRVKDMCKELEVEYTDTTEVALVKVVFSPLGFGYYYLKEILHSWDWSHFRFHSTLPYERKNEVGQDRMRIEPYVFIVEHVPGPSHGKKGLTLWASFPSSLLPELDK